jgi:hypothetical protein
VTADNVPEMCATEEKDEKVQGRINADTDRDEEGEKVQGQIIPDTDRDEEAEDKEATKKATKKGEKSESRNLRRGNLKDPN